MIWRKLNNQTRSHKLVRNKVSCSGKLGARRNRCRGRLCWFWRLCSATLRSKLFLLGRGRFRRSSLRHLLRLVNYTPHRFRLSARLRLRLRHTFPSNTSFFWGWRRRWWGSSPITRWRWWHPRARLTLALPFASPILAFGSTFCTLLRKEEDRLQDVPLAFAFLVEALLSIETQRLEKKTNKNTWQKDFFGGGQNLKEKHVAAKWRQTLSGYSGRNHHLSHQPWQPKS